MNLTKELLEKRIADLQAQFKQIEANGNATIGAISECQRFLKLLSEPEKE